MGSNSKRMGKGKEERSKVFVSRHVVNANTKACLSTATDPCVKILENGLKQHTVITKNDNIQSYIPI